MLAVCSDAYQQRAHYIASALAVRLMSAGELIAELAERYGFTDVDGRRPTSLRPTLTS